MSWLLGIALAVVGLAAVALILKPWTVQLTFQGRGEPSGVWVLGGGAAMGPVALSVVAAAGVAPLLQVHCLGLRLLQWELLASDADDDDGEHDDDDVPLEEQLKRVYGRLRFVGRRVDPLEAAGFLLRQRRRFAIRQCDVDVAFDFKNVALTGQLLGAVYMVAALLPAPVRLRPVPSWEGADRASIAINGAVRVWPGLIALAAIGFLVRRVRWWPSRRPPRQAPAPRGILPAAEDS